MICLDCINCLACAIYLIDDDDPPGKKIDIKEIKKICKVMGGFKSRHGKQVGKPRKIIEGILKAAKKD